MKLFIKFLLLYKDLIEFSRDSKIIDTYTNIIKPIVTNFQNDMKVRKILAQFEFNISQKRYTKKNKSFDKTENYSFKDINILDIDNKFNTDIENDFKIEIEKSENHLYKRRVSRVSKKIMNHMEGKNDSKKIIIKYNIFK